MKKIILLLSLFSAIISFAQTTEDYTIQAAITTQTSPPKITFTWPLDTTTINYTIARKPLSSSSWMVVGGLASHGTHWTDSNLVLGAAYEYQIMKSSTFDSYSYFYAGIQAPPIETHGKLILLVDSTFVDSLATELYQLTKDLIGDGWQVIRHDVSRTDVVTHVKGLIVADYNADPINTKAVFIFGHVPVPYSGDINPDGHPDHHGAWGADVYYGDMDGIWTDNIINDSLASRTQNRNIPGDGKFDQSTLPTDVELQIGRVDLANMPSFALSEQELLRRYLVKDHDYRVKNFSVRPRALVDDNFGAFSGEAFASCGWRMSSLVGPDSISALDYFTTLDTASYQWSYGCGGGTFTSCGGVGATSDFATGSVQTIFTMLFGSYFGDWDSQDNFLRAPLASGTALTCSWAGRPYWHYHQMALGQNIGYCALTNQNNSGNYAYNYADYSVHVALMGDPTLRMHIIAPPSNLTSIVTGPNAVSLTWNPSLDSVLGYYLYRQDTATGFYTRISPNIIAGNSFIDNNVIYATNHYMVRAIRLEQAATGTYYNLSEGSMDTISVSLGMHDISFAKGTVSIYPNPNSGNFIISYHLPFANGTLKMIDLAGREVYSSSLLSNAGKQNILVSNLNCGIYYWQLLSDNAIIETGKLAIIK